MPILTTTTAGSFCRELAAGLEPLTDLLNSWGLTPADYQKLKKNEWFRREMEVATQDVKEMGPDSTFIMRCKVLSEDFLPNIVGMMTNAHTPPEVKAKLFDTITDLARLKPQKGSANSEAGNRGPQVVFNFGPGLKGVPETLTIEASPNEQTVPPQLERTA